MKKYCIADSDQLRFLVKEKRDNLFDGPSTTFTTTIQLQSATRFKTREEAEEVASAKWGEKSGRWGRTNWYVIEIEVFEDGERYILRHGGNHFFKALMGETGGLFRSNTSRQAFYTNRLQNAFLFSNKEEAMRFNREYFMDRMKVSAITCRIS